MISFETNAAILRKLPDDTLEILADKLCKSVTAEQCEFHNDCVACLTQFIEENYK